MTGSTPAISTMTEPSTISPSTESGSKSSARTASRGTRENKQDKALRYLVQGRLRVVRVEGDLVQAECRGDSGRAYELGFFNGRWTCSCPARTDCSHLIALWRVTVV